jgi:hypothetical protein
MLVLALFVAVSIFLHQDPLNAASKDSKYLALSKDVLVTTSATLL